MLSGPIKSDIGKIRDISEIANKHKVYGRSFCKQPTRDIYRRAYKSLFTSLVQLKTNYLNEINFYLQ